MSDILKGGRFSPRHKDKGQKGAHKGLYHIKAQSVHVQAENVHENDLHRKGKGASKEQKVAGTYTCNAHTAKTIKPCHGKSNTNGHHFRGLALQKELKHGHEHNVHGGEERGFSRVRIYKSHLLQIASKKYGNSAKYSCLPQIFVHPTGKEVFAVLFETVGNYAYREQTKYCKKAAYSLEGKRTDMIHAHALSYKRRAPYSGAKQ